MRRARVYNHGRLAGSLDELNDGRFRFQYDASYLQEPDASAVSLTLPLQNQPFLCDHLFAFFYGLLAEGSTRQLQCRLLQIDENDAFGLLLATGRDTIGSVSVEPASEEER
ncbi:phosphatidylinositol kinase [Lujinxingia vulgaris]|uniref:Phosphatidylinositol kinase n=1 Tax=Lujinxingia vulgaris TaxID=2600176 RepID=A0A5C6XHX4_9DELT|nr:HipA N-terminal domain-containing protein [Lujinxingia vulgaris]TXD37722.1 phosphatidylinositol kinase [Lujinxingia vulgaris]